jgi:mRNA interferase HigB
MRIITTGTLRHFARIYPDAQIRLLKWEQDIRKLDIRSPQQLKSIYRNASIINSQRVVFNIKGNHYRLIASINYEWNTIYIVWFGTHTEYDRVDARTVEYEAPS